MARLIRIGPVCEADVQRAADRSQSSEVRQRAQVVLDDFLRRRVPSEIRVLSGQHRSFVNCCEFSPDGELLASVGEDGAIVLWRWKTGAVERAMRGHMGGVLLAAFSPDGKTLATSGRDKRVVLHDVATGVGRPVPKDHNGAVSAVLFSRDGSQLFSASDDRLIFVRNSEGLLRHSLEGHQRPAIALAISADGKTLYSAGGFWDNGTRFGEIKAWDLESRRERWSAGGEFGGVWGIDLSPNGKHLASAGLDGVIRIWDAETGQDGPVLKGHTDRAIWVDFAPHRPLLASASYDGTVRLWDTDKWQTKVTLPAHAAQVQRLSFAPRENILATTGNDQVIRIWRIPE